jgi:uncharacterized integral membrane protein
VKQKIITIAVIVLFFFIIMAQNANLVIINLLFWKVGVLQFVLILIAVLIGFIMGYITSGILKGRRSNKVQ